MKNRSEIVDFILGIECKYPVNSWTGNNICLWPLIRIRLFLYLINSVESKGSTNKLIPKNKNVEFKSNKLASVFRNISGAIKYFIFFTKLKKTDIVFVGADAHRIELNGTRYNRFFDTLISSYNLKNKCRFIEYGIKKNETYENEKNLMHFDGIYSNYLSQRKINNVLSKKKEVHFNLIGYDKFLEELGSIEVCKGFLVNYSLENLKKNIERDFFRYYDLSLKLFSKMKLKKIFSLCYYDQRVMAMVAAANSLNIQTIEMQHGPQNELHLAYGSWFKIPEEGYLVMPNVFWCWDSASKNVIDSWTKSTSKYRSYLGGNPWIDYWNTRAKERIDEKFILYSLQPSPVSIEKLFSPGIINVIKNSSVKWYIRLHPRQIQNLGLISNFLKEKEVLDFVNLDEATNLPLPILLYNAFLHVTHFSGTTIEASLLGVHTVLFNKIGEEYYPDIIKNNLADYIDAESKDFEAKFDKLIQLKSNSVKYESISRINDNSEILN